MKADLMFWFSKILAEFIIFGVLIGVCLLVGVVLFLRDYLKQKMCKHTNYYEHGGNLHIFCRKCGKDLGFTGTFHKEKHKAENDGK